MICLTLAACRFRWYALLNECFQLSIAGVPIVARDRYQWWRERRGYMSRIKSLFSLAACILKACYKHQAVSIFLLCSITCALFSRHSRVDHYCRVHSLNANKGADKDVAIERAFMSRINTVTKILFKMLIDEMHY